MPSDPPAGHAPTNNEIAYVVLPYCEKTYKKYFMTGEVHKPVAMIIVDDRRIIRKTK